MKVGPLAARQKGDLIMNEKKGIQAAERRGRDIPQDRLWSVEEVSYYLGVPVGTLYSWRVQRRGPACRRIGRFLRYRPEDVADWFCSLSDWPTAG
jgi:predicted DNA-binding transcriptional regulator AlpA